jgi:hypothetical protein
MAGERYLSEHTSESGHHTPRVLRTPARQLGERATGDAFGHARLVEVLR